MVRLISIRKNKKAQVWGIDLMIAMIIFSLGILFFFVYILNSSNPESGLERLSYEGNILANVILSEGSPNDWSKEDVFLPGILSKNKINETKLQEFYSLVQNYQQTKEILNTRFDFYFYFQEQIDINGGIDGIGKSGVSRTNILDVENPNNMVKISRFTIYKNKPTQFNLYVWD